MPRGPWATITVKNWEKLKGRGGETIPIRLKVRSREGSGEEATAMITFAKDDVKAMGAGEYILIDSPVVDTPMARYNEILDFVIREIGHEGPTSRSELTNFMREQIGNRYVGTFAAREPIPFTRSRPFAIMNTENEPGDHWLGIVNDTVAQPMIYDSFGRRLFIEKNNVLTPVHTNRTAEQDFHQDDCGQRCCAWLLYYIRYGRVQAKRI